MGKIKSFFTGAALGIAAALLLAPKTGEQTRALVTEKANAVIGEAKDFSAGIPSTAQDALKTAMEKGSSLVKTAADKGQELASSAKDVVEQAQAPAPAQPDDELREKIEAARKRIAAQVAENAEASKAVEVAASAAEAVAEAAE